LYHPLDRRDFRDETLYRDGEFIKERRMRVALDQKTRYGRELQGSLWVGREWETLTRLDGGVPVPRPIEGTQDAILMSYIGDEDVPAPGWTRTTPAIWTGLPCLWSHLLQRSKRILSADSAHAASSSYTSRAGTARSTLPNSPK